MLRNYFTLAFRNLIKYKAYSFINISGLSIGLASSILIFLFILDELSYDKHYKDASTIFRIVLQMETSQGTTNTAMTPSSWAPLLIQQYPEVENAVRFKPPNQMWKVDYQELSFYEKNWAFADTSVISTFSIPIVESSTQFLLREPFTVVISEEMVKKYFPDQNPIGKIFKLDNEHDFTVTGVMENPKPNTHLHFDFIASLITLEEPIYGQDFLDVHDVPVIYTYLKLTSEAAAADLSAQLDHFVQNIAGQGLEQAGVTFTPTLQPLTSIHLNSHLEDEIEANGNIQTIRTFVVIAIFILLIATINYMNLSTARSMRRAKEISMRKVVGAQRKQLILQFIIESVIISLIAMFVALIIVVYALPLFKIISNKTIQWQEIMSVGNIAAILFFAAFIGVLAGIYPALFLSNFDPLAIIKGKVATADSSPGTLRKTLIIVQFSISVCLIICTIILFSQLHFVRNRNPGFTKENVVVLQLTDEVLREYYVELKDRLLGTPHVLHVSASSSAPAESTQQFAANFPLGFRNLMRPVNATSSSSWQVNMYAVDYDFFTTLNLNIIAGRKISRDFPSDTVGAYVINETAAREFGWQSPEEAIGEGIVFADDVDNSTPFQIIGVVNDFLIQSVHESIEPLVIRYYNPQAYFYMLVRINAENVPLALTSIESTWKEVMPNYPFEYSFLDQNFNRLYRSEETLSSLFAYFSILAIIIACLGLFGLASYSIESKVKEIGVRKVLGASFKSLLVLLIKEYTILILLAFIVGSVVAYFAMNIWLSGFAYHIQIDWTHFLISGIFFLIVTLGTVGFKSLNAASKNPAETLRTE